MHVPKACPGSAPGGRAAPCVMHMCHSQRVWVGRRGAPFFKNRRRSSASCRPRHPPCPQPPGRASALPSFALQGEQPARQGRCAIHWWSAQAAAMMHSQVRAANEAHRCRHRKQEHASEHTRQWCIGCAASGPRRPHACTRYTVLQCRPTPAVDRSPHWATRSMRSLYWMYCGPSASRFT